MPTSGALTAPIPGFYNRRGVHVGSTREPGNGTMSPSEGSVSHWLGPLREGDPDAVQRLWERYFQQLIELARKKLRALPHREAAEDVALSAFDSFCRGAEQGRFPQLEDRNNLWHLLMVITARKAARLARDEARQRHGATVLGEAALECLFGEGSDERALEQVLGSEPTPELAAQVAEECRRLLTGLGDRNLEAVAVCKMEGHTNAEIAAQLGYVPRTVERKLHLIRSIWKQETRP